MINIDTKQIPHAYRNKYLKNSGSSVSYVTGGESKTTESYWSYADSEISAKYPARLANNFLLDELTNLIEYQRDSKGNVTQIGFKKGVYSLENVTALGIGSGGGGGGGASTLGELSNVGAWADATTSVDRLLIQRSGATHWSSINLSDIAGSYTLPTASASVLGGVKVGATLEISGTGALNQKSGVVAPGTYVKTNVDTYGRVTGGSTGLVASDIPGISADKIISGTLPVDRGGTGRNIIEAGKMWYASALNTLSEVSTTAFGRGLLSATSGTLVQGLIAESASKLTATRSFWGQPFNGTQNVTGSLTGVGSITMSGNLVISGDYIQLKSGRLYWDSDNNGFKVEKADGSVAGFYATSYVTALGIGSMPTPGGSSYLYELLDVNDGIQNASVGDLLAARMVNGVVQWTNIKQSSIVPDLSGYATQSWVNSQGFLKSITKAQVEAVLTGTISSHTHTFASLVSKPTTLSGYGITDAYTQAQANARYVLKSGDTMSGTLSLPTITITDQNASEHISFNRGGYNYFKASQEGGVFAFVSNGKSIGSANSDFIIEANSIHAGTNNLVSNGTSSRRWSNVYSVLGNFSGMITAAGGITGTLTGNASTATALTATRYFWGQPFNGTQNVTGNLTGVGSITMSGNIIMDNSKYIYMKDTSGNNHDMVRLNASNGAVFNASGYNNNNDAFYQGGTVIIRTNTAGNLYFRNGATTQAVMSSSGNWNFGSSTLQGTYKVQVDGTLRCTAQSYHSSASYFGSGKTATTDGSAGVVLGSTGVIYAIGRSGVGLEIQSFFSGATAYTSRIYEGSSGLIYCTARYSVSNTTDVTSGTSSAAISTSGGIRASKQIWSNTNIYANGAITALATGSSDMRLKCDFKKFSGLELMHQVGRAFAHKWNDKALSLNSNFSNEHYNLSWSAQKIKKSLPVASFELPYKGHYLGIKREHLLPIVWNGLLDLETKVEKELRELKVKYSDLENKYNQLERKYASK